MAAFRTTMGESSDLDGGAKMMSRRLRLLFVSFGLVMICGYSPIWAAQLPSGDAPTLEVFEAEQDTLREGVVLFTDRTYVAATLPEPLVGLPFLRGSIETTELRCLRSGVLYALTPLENRPDTASQESTLIRLGFQQAKLDEFQLYGKQPVDVVNVYWKSVQQDEELYFGKWVVIIGPVGMTTSRLQPTPWRENDGELLYNGIQLPRRWPPRHYNAATRDVLPVPYLEDPPAVISIDVGRQLFVDDFLIADTTLERRFHKAEKYEGNPVLRPETPLELNGGASPAACPFSDGVFYDPQENLFKMWYHAGWFDGTALATSVDGIHWTRPELDVVPGTNRVIAPREDFRRDGVSVWLDQETDNPAERFKMFLYARSDTHPAGGRLLTSPDGVHWTERGLMGPLGDNTTMFYNPFRKKWVISIRSHRRNRTRDYWEHDDFLAAAVGHWPHSQPVFWVGADDLDRPDPRTGCETQLYKVDAVAYESLMLGLMQIHYGPPNDQCARGGFPKLTELEVAFSRDGFHWDRRCRETFIGATWKEGDWDRAYIHSVGGCCLVVGDRLHFYFSAFQGDDGRQQRTGAQSMYANGATGLAFLRRDGFASMEAAGSTGMLTTRPVSFHGKYLFVNIDNPHGELRVDVLDQDGQPISPFTRENCQGIRADSTCQPVTWQGADDLSRLAGQPVRFRFHLTDGRLYSFWVSPETTGASHGYEAAGGPGLNGPTDTRGLEAYPNEQE